MVAPSHRLAGLIRHWSWPLAIASLLYAGAAAAAYLLFGEGPRFSAVPADWALHVALALPLWAAFRSRWGFVLLFTAVVLLLHLGHAGKTATLGGPVAPDDIYALTAFLRVAQPWQQAVVLLGGAAAVGAALFGIGWNSLRRLAAVGVIAAGAAAVNFAPAPLAAWMDRQFGHVEWDQANNYRSRGPAIHTLQEVARFLADRRPLPSAQEVAAALPPVREVAAVLPPARPVPVAAHAPAPPRNLHMIVLESFWDAGLLTAALDEDPLPAEFRELWAATEFSQVLSPVFGGYTANAEFEALCGFPVAEPAVRFERKVTHQVPCLPAVLAGNGYVSVASHPNIPVFWNRHNVYQRIGFDAFWAGDDFVYDDMNREFLSDRSLYRQVLEKIDPLLAADQPLFNYVLTFFGHLPYPLNDARPELFASRSSIPEVTRYASTVHYKARELLELLAALRERDPDGLIVVFGDHPPVLGERFGAYVESGLLHPDQGAFTGEMYLTQTATPLLIIDGQRGPLPVGRLPMYRLPALILALLGRDGPTIFDYTAPPPGMQVRPLPGLHLNLIGGTVELCNDEPLSDTCSLSAEWLRRVDILAADLFTGAQYALPAVQPQMPEGPQPVAADADELPAADTAQET